MTSGELWDAYRTFSREAVRLETLQHYTVPSDEVRQQEFREGRPLSQRPDKQASVKLIADAAAAGKKIWRIHVIDLPLSDYVRYELAAYAENVAAGEDVWIADRAASPGLDELHRDFVLFDAGTSQASLIWYDYTPDGQLIGHRFGTPEDIAICTQHLALARQHAVPLTDFMSSCERAR
jgi:hypothetical protein